MRKSKAIEEANNMSKIITDTCYVIKVRRKFKWYSVYTWFKTFENVSYDYIMNHTYNGKIYYSTK